MAEQLTAPTPHRGFESIAESLRTGVSSFYEERDEPLQGEAGRITLETNSSYAPRRGMSLLELLARERGSDSIEGLTIADLGCGFGSLSLFFASQGASVTGVDRNAPRLRVGRAVAEQHGLDVRFVKARFQELGLPDASFDIAVYNNSLCYVVPWEDRRMALTETLRILRPGGWLITRNANRLYPVDQFTRIPLIQLAPPDLAVRLAALGGRKRSRVRLQTPWAARRELKRAGFVEVSQGGFPEGKLPDFLKLVARYQHMIGRRLGERA